MDSYPFEQDPYDGLFKFNDCHPPNMPIMVAKLPLSEAELDRYRRVTVFSLPLKAIATNVMIFESLA